MVETDTVDEAAWKYLDALKFETKLALASAYTLRSQTGWEKIKSWIFDKIQGTDVNWERALKEYNEIDKAQEYLLKGNPRPILQVLDREKQALEDEVFVRSSIIADAFNRTDAFSDTVIRPPLYPNLALKDPKTGRNLIGPNSIHDDILLLTQGIQTKYRISSLPEEPEKGPTVVRPLTA